MEPIELPLVNGSRPPAVALAGPSRGQETPAPSLEKTAKDFESVFLGQMLEEMQKTVGQGGLLEDGASSQVLSIGWSGLAKDIAGKGGVGLWKDIARQVGRSQDAPQAAAPEKVDLAR